MMLKESCIFNDVILHVATSPVLNHQFMAWIQLALSKRQHQLIEIMADMHVLHLRQLS